jgi:hypothetical protein
MCKFAPTQRVGSNLAERHCKLGANISVGANFSVGSEIRLKTPLWSQFYNLWIKLKQGNFTFVNNASCGFLVPTNPRILFEIVT